MPPAHSPPNQMEGCEGWNDYARFYDWENARTLGRRDVPFWRAVALGARGPVLELGCGTGRVALPLGRAGVALVGVDRSEPMLARARRRVARARLAGRVRLIRGDIRHLPFPAATFSAVVAPYGVLLAIDAVSANGRYGALCWVAPREVRKAAQVLNAS